MNPWEIYGFILVAASSIYLLPQTYKMWKTKKVQDISGPFLYYTTAVHFGWMAFNIHSIIDVGWETLPYFLNNLGRVLIGIITIILYKRYEK